MGWGTAPNKSSTNAEVQHGTFKYRTLRPWCWEGLKGREKGTREDEMVGWHHRLHGHEFEEVLGVGDGQGSLAGHSPWGCKESDTTEWLNWTELKGRENLSKKKGRGQHNCYRLSMFPVKAHLCLIEGKISSTSVFYQKHATATSKLSKGETHTPLSTELNAYQNKTKRHCS